LISGSGSITTPSSPSSGVTGLGVGANTFRWTLPNGVCTDSQDDVIITSHAFTAANAGPDQTVCTTTATLAGNTPATGVGTWSLISGSGSVTNPNTPNSGVTGLGVGANTFRWTLPNGDCTDSSDDIVITRNVPSTDPTSISGTLTIASGSTTTLTATGGTLGTSGVVRWYTGSCGGTLVHTGSTYTTPALTSTTQYWVRYEDACGNSNCVTATVTVTSGCTHTIEIFDDWCDGSDGGYLDVLVNGTVVLDNISTTGCSNSFTFSAQTGDNIQVVLANNGSYPGEISFDLFDGNGNALVTIWYPFFNGSWSGSGDCTVCVPDASGSVTYSAASTSSASNGNVYVHSVELCAGSNISFGCSNPSTSLTGDTYFRLFYNGNQVAANDDACGVLSQITYNATASGTYEMRLGCWNSGSCGGTVFYTITP
jgi:hypothetical protein